MPFFAATFLLTPCAMPFSFAFALCSFFSLALALLVAFGMPMLLGLAAATPFPRALPAAARAAFGIQCSRAPSGDTPFFDSASSCLNLVSIACSAVNAAAFSMSFFSFSACRALSHQTWCNPRHLHVLSCDMLCGLPPSERSHCQGPTLAAHQLPWIT